MTARGLSILAAALALLGSIAPLRAGNPPGREGSVRVLYSIEWGYDATLMDAYHYNRLDSEDGFRIDEKKVKPMLYSNAHASVAVSLEFARRFALGLHAGYAGVLQDTRFFPLSLRSTFFFNAYDRDSRFVFAEGGAGLHETRSAVSPFARLGYGYRFRLTRRASIELSASLRCTYDHPPIYDASIPGYVPEEFILRSDALYGSMLFSVALNF